MRTLLAIAAIALLSSPGYAAAGSWTGQVTADACVATHMKGRSHASAKDARACAEDCLKGGGKLVFVSSGKVYQIANQDMAGLKARMGGSVKLTGDMDGDVIHVSKVQALAAKSVKRKPSRVKVPRVAPLPRVTASHRHS